MHPNDTKTNIALDENRLNAEQKLWLLSLSGHLSAQNGETFDGLNMATQDKPYLVNSYRKMLKTSYSVTSKEELISTLNTFYSTQNSQVFMACMAEYIRPDLLARYISENKSQAYQGLPIGIMSGWAEIHSIPLARGGIRAFDIGRYAFLCRCGVTIGLLTEEEAWQYLVTIGRLAQRLFTSWYGFASSYLVGRCIWQKIDCKEHNYEPGQDISFAYDLFEKIQQATEIMQTALADDEHPWSRTEWRIAL